MCFYFLNRYLIDSLINSILVILNLTITFILYLLDFIINFCSNLFNALIKVILIYAINRNMSYSIIHFTDLMI